jgi:uncharacterized membrane protein YkvI
MIVYEHWAHNRQADTLMPLVIFILIVVLIATFGFWDTVQAVLGAIGLIILFIVLFAALIACIAYWLVGRTRRRIAGR